MNAGPPNVTTCLGGKKKKKKRQFLGRKAVHAKCVVKGMNSGALYAPPHLPQVPSSNRFSGELLPIWPSSRWKGSPRAFWAASRRVWLHLWALWVFFGARCHGVLSSSKSLWSKFFFLKIVRNITHLDTSFSSVLLFNHERCIFYSVIVWAQVYLSELFNGNRKNPSESFLLSFLLLFFVSVSFCLLPMITVKTCFFLSHTKKTKKCKAQLNIDYWLLGEYLCLPLSVNHEREMMNRMWKWLLHEERWEWKFHLFGRIYWQNIKLSTHNRTAKRNKYTALGA